MRIKPSGIYKIDGELWIRETASSYFNAYDLARRYRKEGNRVRVKKIGDNWCVLIGNPKKRR